MGDPRNDENILVSQIQLQMLRLHNVMLARLMKLPKYKGTGRKDEAFAKAQRLTRRHYQWVVIHDFAEKICGLDLIHELLDQPFRKPVPQNQQPGRPRLKFYGYSNLPFMPVEFSVAAFRFGHSQVRAGYKLNRETERPIFASGNTADLQGGRQLPEKHTVQWDMLVKYKGSKPAESLLIDTTMAKPLMDLPDSIVGAETEPRGRSLAFRNILRGHRLSLPSGQAVARRMCVPKKKILDTDKELPLWVYILQEAEDLEKGQMLGSVGGRIVGETLVGLLAGDAFSYFSVDPCWEPDPADGGRLLNLAKLLETAGAPMTRQQMPF